MVVGHAHPVTQHRVGDGDGTVRRRIPPHDAQVALQCVGQRGMLGAWQGDDVAYRPAGGVLPGKACVGAADVGQ